MRDIVATIQADQYGLIRTRPVAARLVVQGGPGTGKTAVGLHRAPLLLYSHREELRRVLLVGPNPTFIYYASHVLPALGEESVEQRAVGELVDGVEVSLVDPPDVERLKADVRMADIVRGVQSRLGSNHSPSSSRCPLEAPGSASGRRKSRSWSWKLVPSGASPTRLASCSG